MTSTNLRIWNRCGRRARETFMTMHDGGSQRRVLVVDADATLAALIGEWLADDGDLDVVAPPDSRLDALSAAVPAGPALILLDLPFRREHALARIAEIKREHPESPIVALSSNLIAGVPCDGRVAEAFGVAAVLSKPLERARLASAVQRFLASQ